MSKASLFPLLSLIAVLSCESPKPSPQNLPSTVSSDTDVKLLPAARWSTTKSTQPFTAYPAMARIARISGDLQLRLSINDQGQVTSVKLISGPVQLAATAEYYAKGLLFFPEQSDLPGPWGFDLTVRFELAGKIGAAPTGMPIPMLPVRTPQPVLPPGVR